MKKIVISLSLGALILASCSIEEENAPFISGGSHLILSGDSYTATKVSIGEKDGGSYPLLWYTGDAISINSKDASVEGAFVGELAELYSESSGSKSGLFQTVNDLEALSDMDLLILYPGSSMSYNEGVITGSVPATQTQRTANSSVHVGNGCFAYGEASIEAGQTEGISFSLSQKTAFVKMTVTLDGYTDYYLTGVSMYAEGYGLSGDISCDCETGEMSVSNPSESVGVTISSASLLSEAQTVYFTTLPCDLTNADVYITLSMRDSASETISLPVLVSGGKLESGCLSVIEIDDSVLLDWYDPVETRDLMSAWAYGKQNTYFVEQKETGSSSITIDVRARGDISKVKKPVYYGLLTGSSESGSKKLCYLPSSVTDYEAIPTNEVSEDCTIDVYIYGQDENGEGNWAVVGLYDEEYNILWSFMIWKYLEGDDPSDVEYASDVSFLDRAIGFPCSNKLAEQNATFGQSSAAYFQFGRKDPFPHDLPSSYSIVLDSETVDVATSIANPTVLYTHTSNVDWRTIDDTDRLWGGEDCSSSWTSVYGATKTIYDPCPAGYRVCDPYALLQLRNDYERWEVPVSSNYQESEYVNSDSPFYNDGNGESVIAHKLSESSYDYWPFAGFKQANKSTDSMVSVNNGAAYWANSQSNGNYTVNKATCLGWYYSSSRGYDAETSTYKQRGYLVRCQKDDGNR